MFEGQQLINEKEGFNYVICVLHKYLRRAALVDINQLKNNSNVKKPIIFTFDKIEGLKNKKGTVLSRFVSPIELGMTDVAIIRKRSEKWIDYRNKRIVNIKPLLDEDIIQEYLFGQGISAKIQDLIDTGSTWKTPGAYYNALNKYIAFGCMDNAFLPFGYKNCGNNYLYIDKPGVGNIKRGCNGKDNRNSVRKHRGFTEWDKSNFLKLIGYFKGNGIKFTKSFAYRVYQSEFETIIHKEETANGPIEIIEVLAAKDCISKQIFFRQFKNLFHREDLLKLKYGDIGYEKDWKPRFERAREGVIGPSYRYEIDATVLDIYVRYTYDTTERLSVGRPVLYFVVDVYTTMIVGYYIGFHGPDWIGAAEAMVNACLPKEEHCAKYGVSLKKDQWPCHHIPFQLTADNGSEYSLKHLEPMLQSMLKLRTVNFVAVYRGDMKGIVERRFGIIQGMTIHYSPGAIIDLKREDAHPSNNAVYDLEALHKIIIRDILHHNNASKRTHLLNKRDAKKKIGLTPKNLWLSNIDEEMNGGNPTLNTQDHMMVRWAFLLKGKASIRDGAIYFNKLAYDSDYAHVNDWYVRARATGAFSITVGWTRATCNFIIFQTDDGTYVELKLKKEDHCERFADEHWDMVMHRQYEELCQEADLEQYEKEERITKDFEIKKLLAEQLEEMSSAPENTRKSMQPDVKARQKIQKQMDMLNVSSDIQKAFRGADAGKGPSAKRQDTTGPTDRNLFNAD
ncbi:MAG: DDE-type integrase/transposase/recombinase [Oceanospirillaceae bacterium]|nr:DDE-type integrase/transposase/recombinase [Oceanospirillaceae bacterium]